MKARKTNKNKRYAKYIDTKYLKGLVDSVFPFRALSPQMGLYIPTRNKSGLIYTYLFKKNQSTRFIEDYKILI